MVDDCICYHQKVYEDIYNLFQTRYRLHTTVYRHSAVVAIHYMVSDALKCSGLPIEESILELDRFLQYDDTVLDAIRCSKSLDMKKSRDIIRRIDERRLYKVVETYKRAKPWDKNPTVADLLKLEPSLREDDVIVDVSCVGFIGKADGHPMDNLKFYDSDKPNKSFSMKRRSVSTLLTPRYCEYWTRIVVKDEDLIDLTLKAWNTLKTSI